MGGYRLSPNVSIVIWMRYDIRLPLFLHTFKINRVLSWLVQQPIIDTGCSLSEGLVFSEIKPKYDSRFVWDLPE